MMCSKELIGTIAAIFFVNWVTGLVYCEAKFSRAELCLKIQNTNNHSVLCDELKNYVHEYDERKNDFRYALYGGGLVSVMIGRVVEIVQNDGTQRR